MGLLIDFVGYETLIDFINEHKIFRLDGDFIEIGAFVGGGTQKLAKLAGVYGKKVFVIDVFDPDVDQTTTCSGTKMSDIYRAFLAGRSQYHEFRNNTRGFGNVRTIRRDSIKIKFNATQKFSFGFVDGNHRSEYVENDFYLIWHHLVSGGAVALHDYNTELPSVTLTIDRLLKDKKEEIDRTLEISEKHILIATKK